MNNTDDLDFQDTSNLKVIYIHKVGTDSDGMNVYHFLINDDCSETWGEEWNEKPAGNCRNLMLDDEQYEYVKELRSEIILDLAQNNTCYSMADCRDKIIALASENIDEYDEYPEPCRIVIHFGDLLDDVERMLAQRDLHMKYI